MNANNQSFLNVVEDTGEVEVMVFSADKPQAFSPENGMGVLKAIHNIQRAILQFGGIAKTHDTKSNNSNFQYKFRSIEDMYNVITPLMVENEVILRPYLVNGRMTKHISKKGDVTFKTVVVMRYTLYCIEDGSFIESCMVGESNDSGDKSSTKAQSVAQKAFFIQTFSIPTANIADNHHSNEPVPNHQNQYQQQQGARNQPNHRNNGQPQANIQYASPEFKKELDNFMRQNSNNLHDVLKNRGINEKTVTYDQLMKIADDFKQFLTTQPQ